jgi:hypothetical protein
MGTVIRLQPVKVLVASRDQRFESVVSFLLGRHGFDVAAARHRVPLDELATRHGATLAVVDADTFPAYPAQLANLDIAVVAVGEFGGGTLRRGRRVLPKWGPFPHLLAELDRLLVAQPRAWARVQSRSESRPFAELADASVRPSRPGA